jgi:GNAT superfamily N-acetyltransferase
VTTTGSRARIDVRPYDDDDEPAVLDLLNAALEGSPVGRWSPEFFRWKHLDNPFGRSFILVASAGERIVGLRAFMRWRFRVAGRSLRAVRAVDTSTHPEYQGQGIFSRLTREALERLREDTDFVFNTPNEKSLPGYLKMGWKLVGEIPVWVRVRRPLRFATSLRFRTREEQPAAALPAAKAPLAREVLEDGAVGRLLEDSGLAQRGITTQRDLGYLRWRYGSVSELRYQAVTVDEAGSLQGMALFRVRPRGRLRETTVAELIVPPGDVRTASRLLRAVVRAASVDHVACHFSAGSPASAARRGAWFLPAPDGVTLTVNPLKPMHGPDPCEMGSWALSLGDVEVF